ncbi:NYN domain-containing protein [Eleftheria terrae]|uniref:NYN domain-containing protein n=1 Tax=Eleftheria terrae TaxID=1597781 RepID=UPI00263B1005|nr:NYN domain-containing protein [Eleftheria terrae]WKB50543.1 NYN domain-containing protein [Eleftheria terrae]
MSAYRKHNDVETPAKATAVYIDGYNLYYGRLRGTEFKWLDVVALFDHILHVQDPGASVVAVKFFTAPALTRFASHGDASMQAQMTYHRALENRHPERFSIILGTHVWEKNGTALPQYIEGEPFDKNKKVKVWRLVEKKTDVNLAMAMYRDAVARRYDQVVLCSNDSDAEPVLQALREDFPELTIGVVTPIRPRGGEGASDRRVSTSLSAFAHWTRQHIRDEELRLAQLPAKVPTRKKPAVKPDHW